MIRILILLTVVILFGCSQSPQKQANDMTERKIAESSTYPLMVDSMRLQSMYDIAKWSLYCIYCDDTVKLRKGKNYSHRTFGTLDLRFAGVEKRNDSVEFKFYFYIDGIRCDLETVASFGNKFFANGVLFIEDTIAFYTTPGTMQYFWQGGSHNRFYNPLQPEVIAFIENNKDQLDPWFREEAKRRKVIE